MTITVAAPTTSVSATLDRAADLIEHLGWVQHTYSVAGLGICASEAINRAAFGLIDHLNLVYDQVAWTVFQDSNDAFRRHVGWYPHNYNDQPGRTKGQVVVKLREVAAAQRGEGR